MQQREVKLKLIRYDRPADVRLGRHVNHDAASLRFLARAADPRTLKSIRHANNLPVTRQVQGSCTGHAATGAMGCAPFWRAARQFLAGKSAAECESFAVGLYSAATALDPWPGTYLPDDTGSDGLSVAKALRARGLVSGFQHATSLAAALTALAERPVLVGTSWLSGMWDPDAEGRMDVSGTVEGGHEYLLDELDVERERVWFRQSWGQEWGQQGRAWFTWDDFGRLLADNGDATILVPADEPAPTPSPAPTPAPAAPMTAEELALAKGLGDFLPKKACPAYVAKPARAWLATKQR